LCLHQRGGGPSQRPIPAQLQSKRRKKRWLVPHVLWGRRKKKTTSLKKSKKTDLITERTRPNWVRRMLDL
jgi:hypothetical protein